MMQFLEQKLRDDVEGTCDGRYGYIVKVVAIDQLGEGTVVPGTGLAEFNATYRAIVLKPVSYRGGVDCGRLWVARRRRKQWNLSSE